MSTVMRRVELRYTTDGWRARRFLRTDGARNHFAPDGRITLAGVHPKTPVERAHAEVWLNDVGRNYRQATAPVTL